MTIKDLAARSGYAVGTVSRVLNNQPNVSEKARRTILAIARAEGFELNSNAKNLKQQRSNSLLAVVRGVYNQLFADLVEHLQSLTAGGDYRLVVDYIDEGENEVRRARQLARELKPQGILFLGGSSENFRDCFGDVALPSVLVTNYGGELGFPNLSSVTTDDRAAAAAAIGYLIAQGHRQIGVIGGSLENSDTSSLRYAGCVEAFQRAGVPFDPARRYQVARYSYAGGYAAMTRLLESERELTAVFAMSDTMAIGAARAARDAGRSIPGDISLVGFDGLPICGYYQPRLATVIQRTTFMAETSLRLLDDMIRCGAGARHVLAPYELAPNGSVLDLGKKNEEDRL